MVLINKQTENTPRINPLSFYIINCNITFIHTQILKHKLLNSRTCYGAWTTTGMGGRSSLPIPGECSNNDFSGPPSLFWSAWLELGGANNKVLVLRLNTNSAYCSKIFQLPSCTRSTFCSFTPQTPSFKFPFPNEFLEVHSTE